MKPILIEPGTKYFIHKTLEQCKEVKYSYYNTMFNIIVFLLFVGMIFLICYYGYKNKKSEKKNTNEKYIQELIDKIQQEKEKEIEKKIYPMKNTITNLPPMDNYFMESMKKFL